MRWTRTVPRAQEWAELDPSNGVPWLLLAGAAHAAKNPVAEAAAFRRLAGSSQFDAYSTTMLSFAEPAIPAGAGPIERQYLLIGAMGVVAATAIPPYQEIGRYCSKDGVQDDEVRQQCARVAELLVVKGTTVLDLMMARSTGARAGWPAARVATVAEYSSALQQSIARASPSGPAMWSCESVQATKRYLRAVSEQRENAAARDAMLQSGFSPAELAKQWQEFLDTALHRESSAR